jgi:hypothetical protein
MTEWDFFWKMAHDAIPVNGIAGALIWSVIVIMTVVQVVKKIPFEPWTWIFNKLGVKLNQSTTEQLKSIGERLQAIEIRQDKQEEKEGRKDAEDARNRILRFGDEIREHRKHSQEYFRQILVDIDNYNAYCKEHPEFPNERTVSTSQIIKDIYEQSVRNNDFL